MQFESKLEKLKLMETFSSEIYNKYPFNCNPFSMLLLFKELVWFLKRAIINVIKNYQNRN